MSDEILLNVFLIPSKGAKAPEYLKVSGFKHLFLEDAFGIAGWIPYAQSRV
jgi:hypothetical protein